MDFAFSAEQDQLRTAVRDWLDDTLPLERVAEIADSDAGWDPSSWRAVHELGLLGLAEPEDVGGAGGSFLDEAVVFEETGRGLYPGPLFSTVCLALPALVAGGATERVLAGDRTATLAWAEPGGPTSLAAGDQVRTRAEPSGQGWTVTGDKRFVPDLEFVDDVVVVAQTPEGPALLLVDLTADRSPVVRRSTMDRTRRLGDLHLAATPARLLVPAGDAAAVLTRTRHRALAALACEATGVAQRCLDLAAAYVTQREQFGRVIGTYQGVSHKIADIFTELQLARSLAYWAAWTVAVGDPGADLAVAAASSATGDAAVDAAEKAIQAMGGIGFTWDHPLHRFYKRAQWIAAFEGGGRTHRAEVAAALLDG